MYMIKRNLIKNQDNFCVCRALKAKGDDRMWPALLRWAEPKHVIRGSQFSRIMLTLGQIQVDEQTCSMYVAIEVY
jgi:hypothetical protein